MADLKRIEVGTRAEVIASAQGRACEPPRPASSSPSRPTTAPSDLAGTGLRLGPEARRGDRKSSTWRGGPGAGQARLRRGDQRNTVEERGVAHGRRGQGARPRRHPQGQVAELTVRAPIAAQVYHDRSASSGNMSRPACRCSRWSTLATSGCASTCARIWSRGSRSAIASRCAYPPSGDRIIDGRGPHDRDARRICRLARDARDRRFRPQDLRSPRLSGRPRARPAAGHERLRGLARAGPDEAAAKPGTASRRGARVALDLARPGRACCWPSACRSSPSPSCRSPSAMRSSATFGSTSSTPTAPRPR